MIGVFIVRTTRKLRDYIDKNIEVTKDQDFIEKAKSQIKENSKSTKRKIDWKKITVIASSLAVIVIILTIVILAWPNASQPQKVYYAENEAIVTSSVEQLNEDLTDFKFANLLNAKVNRVYDKVYNDTLFYMVEYQDNETFESIRFSIIVNAAYDSLLNKKYFEKEQQFNNYILKYNDNIELEDDIYFIYIDAKLVINNIAIFIDYDTMSDVQENGLVVLLNKCLLIS